MFREMEVGLKNRNTCNKISIYLCIIVLVSFVSTLTASATMVAETGGFSGNIDIGYAPDIDFSGNLSFSFTTDNSDYTFNSVTLFLGVGETQNASGGSFFVTLNEENGAVPGLEMERLSGETSPIGNDVEYQYGGTSNLTANTTLYETHSSPKAQKSIGHRWL